MSYDYATQRPMLFTENGVEKLTRVRDNVRRLLDEAGAFQMQNAWEGVGGDCWALLACVDYLVERREIREIPYECAGQHRVFVSAK